MFFIDVFVNDVTCIDAKDVVDRAAVRLRWGITLLQEVE